MKKVLSIFALLVILTSCVTIPKETVTLSKTIGSDLVALHNSHRNMVRLYYNKIEDDINTFIDDVYAPYIIHYVLKKELGKYQNGDTASLYGIIEAAGKSGGKEVTEEALNVMTEFQEAANAQIRKKRNELLNPVEMQEMQLIETVDKAYENAIYANSTITGYLESVQKLKKTQQEALSLIGLPNADSTITNTLIKVSEQVSNAVEEGNDIDVKSDDAYNKIKEITDRIKQLTTKN